MSGGPLTTDEREIPTPTELAGKSLRIPSTRDEAASTGGLTHSPAGPKSADYLREYSEHLHLYIREYIAVADRKASFTFTVGAALLVYLFEKGIIDLWKTGSWSFSAIVAFAASIGLFISVVLSVFVVFPRTVGTRRGFVFWESIAKFQAASEFADAASKLSKGRIADEMLRHAYELSRICRAKYRVLNWSIRVGTGSAVCAILYLFL